MEKANFFMNDGYGIEIHGNESDQLQNCFFNPNWQNTTSIVQNSDPFESALSSMVSSPATSNAIPSNGNGGGGGVNSSSSNNGGGDNFVLRELIGRLGSICNSGEMSPNSYINNGNNNSTNTSCYSTPLNSPPKLNLSMMDQIRGNNLSHHSGNYPMINVNPNMSNLSADPGFAERAARFSCFAGTNHLGGGGGGGGLINESEFVVNRQQQVVVPKLEPGKLSRVSSNQCIKVLMSGSQSGVEEFKDGGISAPHNSELGDSRENSSVSEQIPVGQNGSNSRKRKSSVSKAKAKETTTAKDANANANANVSSVNNDISNVKRSKSEENNENDKDSEKVTDDEGNQKQSKDNQKLPEPLKDYIHVRARRGQATDAHSLAERVRREKISERMKLLQDLVPGCNKVTGKAVMLDEIINYVQSLQRQVEFLSMKLATVNPSMEFNMETLLSKDMFQSRGSLPHNMYPSETSGQEFPYGFQSQQGPDLHKGTESLFTINPLNPNLVRKPSMLLPSLDGFVEPNSQVPTFFEDDLHSVVQMGFGQNQTHNFPGDMATSQMKAEL